MPFSNYTTFKRDIITEGKQVSEFFKVSWSQEKPVPYSGYENYSALHPVDNARVYHTAVKPFRSLRLANNFSFSGYTLETLRTPTQSGPYRDNGYWSAIFNEDSNGRISASQVTVTQAMPGMAPHIHQVFKSIEFCNIALTLEFQTSTGAVVEKILYFDQDPINQTGGLVIPLPANPIFNERYFGSSGNGDGKKEVMFQVGVCKSLIYFIKCGDKAINVIIDFSIVFRYPDNDFEPVQVIMANKIYPQITFGGSIGDFSPYLGYESEFHDITNSLSGSGLLLNTAKITKYHGRIKMVTNNNSDAHLDLQPDGAGNTINYNYLTPLRDNNLPIPNNFEIVFLPEYTGGNVVGFYADTNMGEMQEDSTLDERLQPKYVFNPAEFVYANDPSPFWFNAFDYMNYNIQHEKQFTGVFGKDSDKYQNNGSFKNTQKIDYSYPVFSQNKKFSISLKKNMRQGGFDNIHLHGYLGHYKDNQRFVIHAPICGYCCFHMHWRWGALAVEVADSFVFRVFSNGLKAALDRGFKSRFMGWGKKNGILYPKIVKGNPLIPWNQTLKIAVTNPLAIAKNDLTDVTPTPNGHQELSNTEKAVWYSATITNENNFDVHVVLEQGCGYAFDYSDIGKQIIVTGAPYSDKVNLPQMYRFILQLDLSITSPYTAFLNSIFNAGTGVCSLSVSDMYEIQYRLMHFFNTSRGGNGNDSDPSQLMNCKDYDQVPSKSSADLNDPLNFPDIDLMENQY